MKELFEDVIATCKANTNTPEAKSKVLIKLLQLQMMSGEKDAVFPEDLFSSLDSQGREALLNAFIMAMTLALKA